MEQEGIYVYGSGECDQLGNIKNKDGDFILESKIPRYLPINGITEVEKIYKISCGGMHTLLLTSQGNIYSWGCSDGGTLGREGTDNIPTKVNINIPIEGISAGDCHSIAYNDKLNKIFFWGTFRNSQGEIGEHIIQPMEIDLNLINNEDIVKAISGCNHVVILTEQGHVYAFGNKEFGQTGIDISKVDNSKKIENEHLIPNKIKGENVINIYTGGNHSFLIQNDRRKIFKSWGCNIFGQLGINNNVNQFEPKEILFPEENIEIISCTGGEFHTIVLTSNYHIYSWGKNDESQCGLPIINEKNAEGQDIISCIIKPTRVEINENDIKEIDSKGNYNFAYNPENGKAYSWGFGSSYVLGNKDEENEAKPFEINKDFFKNMRLKNISLGNQHVCLELERFDKSYVKTTFEFDYAANGFSIRNKVIKRKGENYDKKERSSKKRRRGSKGDNDGFLKTEKKNRKKRRRRRKDKGKEEDSDEEYVYYDEEEEEAEEEEGDEEDEEEEEEIEKKNIRKRRNYRKKSVSKSRRKKKNEEEEEDEIEEKKRKKRRNYGKKSVSKLRRKKKDDDEIEEEEEEEEEEEIEKKKTKRRNYGKKSVSKSRKKTKRNDDIEENEEEEIEEKKTKRRNYGKKSVSKSRKKTKRNDDKEEDEEEEIDEKIIKRRNYGKKSVSKSRKKIKENEDENMENEDEEIEEMKTKRRNYGKKSVSKSRKKIKENEDENMENEDEENNEIKTKRKNYGKRSVSKSRKTQNENNNENIEIKVLKEEINITPIKKVTKNIKTTGAKSNRKTKIIEIEKTINIKNNLSNEKDQNILDEINEEEDDSNTSETVGIVKDVKLIRYSDSDNEKNDKLESNINKRTYKKRSKSKSNVKTKDNKTERKSNRKYTHTSRSKSNVKKKGNRSVKK